MHPKQSASRKTKNRNSHVFLCPLVRNAGFGAVRLPGVRRTDAAETVDGNLNLRLGDGVHGSSL